jgi:hypothetical protein
MDKGVDSLDRLERLITAMEGELQVANVPSAEGWEEDCNFGKEY